MITPTTFELSFSTSEPLTFEPGQFVSIIIPGAGPNGRDLRRAYSIASTPERTPIDLCVKLVEGGPGTNYLYRLRPGDQFRGFAPYGSFVYESKPDRHVVFISTGTGIAPFRAMLQSQSFVEGRQGRTVCMLGVRTEDELLYVDEIRKYLGDEWLLAVSQPRDADWSNRGPGRTRGRVTDILRNWKSADFDWVSTDFYLCGNGAMITEVTQILLEAGVSKEAIFKEKYY